MKLQFRLIKPLLEHSMTEIHELIDARRDTVVFGFELLAIVLMSCTVGVTVYLFCVPLKTMDEKVLFTKELIAIIPS